MTTVMIPAWVQGRLEPVEKMAVHRNGLRHKAVSVFVMCENAVLLQRRALSKYHTPGLWANTCCTHPHWNEAPMDCAERRLEEELGISGLTLERRDRIEYRADVGDGLIEHEVVDLFVAEVARSHPLAVNPEEVAQTRWMEVGELYEQVRINSHQYTPWLRIYLERFGELIFRQCPLHQTAYPYDASVA